MTVRLSRHSMTIPGTNTMTTTDQTSSESPDSEDIPVPTSSDTPDSADNSAPASSDTSESVDNPESLKPAKTDFWRLPFLVLRWLIRLVFGEFRLTFSEFSWQPPRWVEWVGRGVCAAVSAVWRKPKFAVGFMAVLVALMQVWVWLETQPKPPEPDYVEWTVEHPSRTDFESEEPTVKPLKITFSVPVAALKNVDKEVADEDITMSPPFKGKWKWEGEEVLTLLPETDWPVGGEYKITFSPKLFRPEARIKSYEMLFLTPRFEVRSLNAHFYQDPTDSKGKKVVASVNFTHPVDTVDFETRVSLVIEGQSKGVFGLGGEEKTAFQVSFDEKKLNAYIHSVLLPLPDEPQTMRVTIDKGVRSSAGGNGSARELIARATIPGIGNLAISSLEARVVTTDQFQPEQVLLMQTSMLLEERVAKNAIKAWLLPEQPPKGYFPDGQEATDRPYAWSDYEINRIDAALLKHGQALKLEALPTENDVSELFSYRYKAPQGRYLYVQIPKGLTAFGGYRLTKEVARIFRVPTYPSMVKIMAEGSLLPLSGERKLSVLARDVPAVRYTIGRMLPQHLQLFVNRSLLGSSQFSKPEFRSINEFELVERFEKTVQLPKLEPGTSQYQALDLGEYLKSRRGIFMLHIEGYDPETQQVVDGRRNERYDEEEGYYEEDGEGQYNEVRDSRLVIVSDLGLIEKQTVDGQHDLFVQSIHQGGPVAGATIEVIGRNGLPVLKAETNASGHATFPRLDDFKNEREPVFFLVSKGDDLSFLPYNRYNRFNRHLNYSRFEVGGAVNAVEARQLSAYLFSDRGIYRPGEEIRIGMIVRATDWTQPVAGIPLELEVIDARGLTVRRDRITLPESGFGELRHPTLDVAPAGTYTIKLSLIKNGHADTQIGSTTVRVQDFEPDRLRMRVRFSEESTDGWVKPDDLTVQVSLQNLFETPAENRRVRGFMSLTPGVLTFPRYKDYLFNDPQQRAKEPVTETLEEVTTDAEGMATLKLDLQRFARATYRANLVVQGFEADGGRGVSGEATALVSGLDYLVGYKPDGNLDYVRRDSARKAHLLAIGSDGKQRAVEGLKLLHIERRYVSVLTRQDDGTYRYQSKEKEVLLGEKPLTIAAAGQTLNLATGKPGAFSYVVRDAEELEVARIAYNVAGEANLTRALDKNAELKLTLSKGDFAPGEEIEVQIEAPYTGHALMTIERDRVYTHRWFSTKTTSTVQKIRLPEEVNGNAYLTVTFVRDPGSDEIYMSPLSYGVVPFSVSRERYQLKLDMATPDKIKPGETATFSLKSNKTAKAVVFAVDEGILQVARYKTADPLGYFFQKRALEVTTSQLLDLILPEFSKVMASAPGGDGEGALGRFLNPFKRKRDPAVAYWSGIVDVGPDGKTVSWQVPESFNGSLRVMAVAVTSQTVGVSEARTIVRGDFVLSPNAPLTVTPGDEFDLPVGVSNQLERSGSNAKVKVTLDVSPHFEVLGDKTIEASIPENRESVVHFRVRAKPKLGSGTLAVTAGIGKSRARLATTVSVRPATQYRQELQVGFMASNKVAEIPTTRKMFAERSVFNVGVSASPSVLANGLASYLGNFPYTCTEQLVSQMIPAVVLSHRPEFGTIKATGGATLAGLIATLRSRQNEEGAYGLYVANSSISEPASVWVQQFLIEAKERGDAVPEDMLQRGNAWLQNFAASEGRSLHEDRLRAQAVYILTRQGMLTSTTAAAIQKRLETRDAKTWKNDLAAAYLAATYKMLKQDRLADSLLADFRFGVSAEVAAGWYDDLSRSSTALFLLARHFPEQARKELANELQNNAFTVILNALSRQQNTSYSSGQLLLALDAWATLAEKSGDAKFRVHEVLGNNTSRALTLSSGLVQRAPFTQEAVKLSIRSDSVGFYAVEASGFDLEPPTDELREGAEILREYTDASGKPLTTVKQGDEVYVHLKFRGLNWSSNGTNMAVVDLLPGGFDLVLNPPRGEANSNESQQALRRDESSEYDEEGGRYGENGGESRWWPPFGNSPTNWWIEYADMREDRIVLYTNLTDRMNEFIYKIRATNVGTYTLPPAYAEGMYRRDIRAHSLPGKKLIVTPAKE